MKSGKAVLTGLVSWLLLALLLDPVLAEAVGAKAHFHRQGDPG